MVGIAEPDMPTYEFGCDKCKLVFEHLYMNIPKKLPKRKKCPECGKQADRVLSATTFKVSGRVAKIGKSNVHSFYNEAIQDTRDRLKVNNTPSPYKRYVPNYDVLTKDGTLRKMSQSEVQNKHNSTRKVGDNINNIKDKLVKKKKNV
jgi:putative FmdB family regulatory protein